MPKLEIFGAPLLNHITNRIVQITERLKPPAWLQVTDPETQTALTEQLAQAWRAYQTANAQSILERAGVSFYELNKPHPDFPQPSIAVLGKKPDRVYNSSYVSRSPLDEPLSFPPVPAIVISHAADDKNKVRPETYVIYAKDKPHAFVDGKLVTYYTSHKNGEPAARLRLTGTPAIKIIFEHGGYWISGQIPAYCSLNTASSIQKYQGTFIVPANYMLILGQPSLFNELGQYRRPFEFLWVESFRRMQKPLP